MGEVLGGDAGPAVAHDDLAVLAANGADPPGWAPLAGVVEQVANGAREAVGIGRDPALVGMQVEGDTLGTSVRGRKSHGVLDEKVQAQRIVADRHLVTPGQFGQVTHQVGELLQLDQDIVDEHRAIGLGELVDAADHLEVGAQAGQGGAQLV